MATIVLIHGAWHGGWCWEEVTPLLEQQGYKVIAPDLPGMGEDKTPLRQITLDGWAEFVAEIIAAQGEPVILVGHSRAGIVISQAAECVPERISALVYLAAFLPSNGATLLDTMMRIPPRPESEGSLVFAPDGVTSTIAPDAVARVFYNTTPAPLVTRAARLVGPEPTASFTTPLRVTPERFGRVPGLYIQCTEDRAIAPALQTMMTAETPCREVIRMETDHSPFYSAPTELAGHLSGIAKRAAGLAVRHEGQAR